MKTMHGTRTDGEGRTWKECMNRLNDRILVVLIDTPNDCRPLTAYACDDLMLICVYVRSHAASGWENL